MNNSIPQPKMVNSKQYVQNYEEINWHSTEDDFVYCFNCHTKINRTKLRDNPELYTIYDDGQISCKNCNFN